MRGTPTLPKSIHSLCSLFIRSPTSFSLTSSRSLLRLLSPAITRNQFDPLSRRFASSNSIKMEHLLVKKLSEHATLPVKGSKMAAGFDLCSAYDYTVKAHGKELVKTDLSIRVPQGTYGRVAPRSGLAVKHFIDIGAGVIDRDYRGNVGIVLFNFGEQDFEVKKGDKVAQLVLEQIFETEVEEVDSLDETERGEGGFGSTGLATKMEMEPETKRLKVDGEAISEKSVENEF